MERNMALSTHSDILLRTERESPLTPTCLTSPKPSPPPLSSLPAITLSLLGISLNSSAVVTFGTSPSNPSLNSTEGPLSTPTERFVVTKPERSGIRSAPFFRPVSARLRRIPQHPISSGMILFLAPPGVLNGFQYTDVFY